jgi:ABC-type transport system involved in multi-copper enzyme maturation permease subunit
MSQLLDLVRHEFGMSIRRPGLWISYGLLMIFFVGSLVLPFSDDPARVDVQNVIPLANLWQYAGEYVFQFNVFLPVVVGILAADRMQRDFRLGVRELQGSTPLSLGTYILGKYLGVLASMFLPVFVWIIALGALLGALGLAPWQMLYALPVACLAITLPAFAFVTAFSLACPLIMPLRVYQILFVGYWFWGNFISPEFFPTLNGTLLTAGGSIAFNGFFGGFPARAPGPLEYTPLYASLNLIVLALCIVAALATLFVYLGQKARRA